METGVTRFQVFHTMVCLLDPHYGVLNGSTAKSTIGTWLYVYVSHTMVCLGFRVVLKNRRFRSVTPSLGNHLTYGGMQTSLFTA
jgi:hypothetical protein